jgi:hypothetical protein
VFDGTSAVPGDDEAAELWRDAVGVDPARILRLGEKDNFWRMGDTGPCGPCSEIHFDLGADLTSVAGVSTPATDSRRYVEIWNLVFMQFDQKPDGTFAPLPAPSIDTGMGLERIASVLAGKRSNYDTDLFQPILQAIAQRAATRYGADEASDTSMRVIAGRACALLSRRRRHGSHERQARLRTAAGPSTRDPARPEARLRGALPSRPRHRDQSLGDVYPNRRARSCILEIASAKKALRRDRRGGPGAPRGDQEDPAGSNVLPGPELFPPLRHVQSAC